MDSPSSISKMWLSIRNRRPKKPTDTDLLKVLYISWNIKKSATKFKISAGQIDREFNCEEFKKNRQHFWQITTCRMIWTKNVIMYHCAAGVITDQIRFQLQGSCADPKLSINRSNGYKQRRFLHFVRDAVYAVAYALRDMQVDICGEGYTGICEQMRPVDERMFSRYLAKVSFKGGWRKRDQLAARKVLPHPQLVLSVRDARRAVSDEAGNRFGFANEVDGPPRYSILNYQRRGNASYQWVVVGNYTRKQSNLSSFWRWSVTRRKSREACVLCACVRICVHAGPMASRRARKSGASTGSGGYEVPRRADQRIPYFLLRPALRSRSHSSPSEGRSVLLEVPELRALRVQGGRAEVRRVRMGYQADQQRHRLRDNPRTIHRPLESMGHRGDGDRRIR